MNDQEIFLRKVSELFFENGAKAVTMDDVAKHHAISKRTLYEEYKNKEELLGAVLDWKLEQIIQTINGLETEKVNAIDRILLRDKDFEKFSCTNQSVFIRQLIKYYPAIFDQHITRMNSEISVVLKKNIEVGRQQGLYRETFNEDLYIRFFLQLMLSFENSPLFAEQQEERAEFCFEGVVFYLQAITTEKGRKILDKVSFEDNQADNNLLKN